KMMLVLGVSLSIPASIAAAYAPSDIFLIFARIVGGISAGMAYPTTLALITALWAGPARTKAIALWSAIGGGLSALGPLVAGGMLQHFWWGSVFLVTLPLAALALVLAIVLVPSHVNETSDPVDNLGGVVSAIFVGALIVSINFASVPNEGTIAIGLGVISGAAREIPCPTCTPRRAAPSGSRQWPASSCSARSWQQCSSASSSCRTSSATRPCRPAPPSSPPSSSWSSSRPGRRSSSSRTVPASRCCSATCSCCWAS